jgi:hypothetical protein
LRDSEDIRRPLALLHRTPGQSAAAIVCSRFESLICLLEPAVQFFFGVPSFTDPAIPEGIG